MSRPTIGAFHPLDAAARWLALVDSRELVGPFLVELERSSDQEREESRDPSRQRDRLGAMALKIVENMRQRA